MNSNKFTLIVLWFIYLFTKGEHLISNTRTGPMFRCVKQSSSSPGRPAPCPHSKTVAWTPSPGFTEEQVIVSSYITVQHRSRRHVVKHSLWASCVKPVAAEVGTESSGWVRRASCTLRGHWPYQSPTHHPPYSSHCPSSHTGSCKQHREASD